MKQRANTEEPAMATPASRALTFHAQQVDAEQINAQRDAEARARRVVTCKGPSLDESSPCPDDAQLRQLSSGEGATRCTSCGVEAFLGRQLER